MTRNWFMSAYDEHMLLDQRIFDDKGFAILPEVLGEYEIARLEESFSNETGARRSKAGVRHMLSISAVANIANDEKLLGIARHIVGSGAVPFRATSFDKSPKSNWLVAWHQDTALPIQEKKETPGWGPWSAKGGVTYAHAPASALERVVALRIHLDDSTAENGPLRFLPETHTLGVLSDEAIHNLAGRISFVECLVPRGGVLAMRPLIVHASSKVRSNERRRVLHLEYAAAWSIGDGFELAVA